MIPELLGILCGICDELCRPLLPEEIKNETEGGDTCMTPELLQVLREISEQLGRIAAAVQSLNWRR